jgi:hypothetical protein
LVIQLLFCEFTQGHGIIYGIVAERIEPGLDID